MPTKPKPKTERKPPPAPPPMPAGDPNRLRVIPLQERDGHVRQYDKAAKRCGMSRASWCRTALRIMAARATGEGQPDLAPIG